MPVHGKFMPENTREKLFNLQNQIIIENKISYMPRPSMIKKG
jgi:hypothetical protein